MLDPPDHPDLQDQRVITEITEMMENQALQDQQGLQVIPDILAQQDLPELLAWVKREILVQQELRVLE